MKRSNTRLVTVATSGAHHAFSFIGTDVTKSTFTGKNPPFVVMCLDFVVPFNSTLRVIVYLTRAQQHDWNNLRKCCGSVLSLVQS